MHFLHHPHYLSSPWGNLAFYHRPGTGPPLLFLHGTGCDSGDWSATFDCLPDEAHIVALDFQGHGQSEVPTRSMTLGDLARDALQLIDQLSLESVVLVGHSLGGMVAMAAASQCDRIAGLVLLEGWTSLRAASAFGQDRFYGNLAPEIVDEIQRKMQQTTGRFTPDAWQSFWDTVIQFDGTACLEKSRAPILEVYGERGKTAKTEAELLVPPSPAIEWLWIPNAGHYLPHERPTDVSRACETMTTRLNQ
jgi:pimeloyl-ACP methyl ester carboxylesterase